MPLPSNLPSQLGWLRNERLQFSPAAVQMLGHYVYMLLHPDDGRVFYVGEGQRHRVFDHLLRAVQLISDGALQIIADDETDPENSEKLGTIAEILSTQRLPMMHIVRDGMATQQEAQRVEGALIDVLDYLATLKRVVPPLTNQQAGHGVTCFRTVHDVEATHGESFNLGDLPALQLGETVLFVNVNRRWGEVVTGKQSLLEVAQGRWRLSPARAAACRYVVAHAWGIVRGVFLVDSWSSLDLDRRISFQSASPDGLPGAAFRGRNIGFTFGDGRSRGSQNPVRYVRYQP